MTTAVFGAGYWGRNHVRILKEDLAVICDTYPDALDKLGEEYKDIPKVTTADQVWKIPQVKRVVIVTPPETHFGLVKDALNHDLDVFVEKPFVQSSVQAEELHEQALSKGLILMVGHIVNYHPTIGLLLGLIRSEKYGRLRKIEAQRQGATLRHDIDVMWDLGVHDVSVALRLLGEAGFDLDATSVKAMHTKVIGIQPNTVFTQARFVNSSNGREALLEIYVGVHNSAHQNRMLHLVFDSAMVSWDSTKGVNDQSQLKLCEFRCGVNGTANMFELQECDQDFPFTKSTKMPLDIELEHFKECCESRSTPVTDGAEGIRVVQFLELVSAFCDSQIAEGVLEDGSDISEREKPEPHAQLMSASDAICSEIVTGRVAADPCEAAREVGQLVNLPNDMTNVVFKRPM